MKLLVLFATIYVAFVPTSLSVLVPRASVIDWMSIKNDELTAYLNLDSKEQDELDLQNTVDYKPSLKSNNSNDSGNNHDGHQYARLYFIFFQPYTVGNGSKWKKSHNYREAFGNTPDKGINRYENVVDGVLSDENKKILKRKAIFPHWYVMHMPSNKKNTTNGTSNMKQYNGIPKRKSPTDFIQPHAAGNVSEWQKSSYEEGAMDNAHSKGVNRYGNVVDGVLSSENKKILKRKPIFPYWYVMHMPSNKKNTTNGASNIKQYNSIPKRKSPTDFIQPHTEGKVSEGQKSSYEEGAMDNAHSKGVNRYGNVTGEVFEENIKVTNNKAGYSRWYVIPVPNHKKNVANRTSNKKQYSDIAKGKSEPTGDSQAKGDIGNSERENMETVESKGKHINISKSNKVYPKIFYFRNKQNLKLNESEKKSVIPIYKILFAKYFKFDGKKSKSNKDWKESFKINSAINPYMSGSNRKSRKATEVVQPEEKEHEAKYNEYYFYSYFGEYPEGITTQITYDLKHEVLEETEKSNEQFQMKGRKENHPRKKWEGEGHDNGAHDAYFIISNFADKQTRFSRQKRQVKTNKESEGIEQGKNLHDILTKMPLGNASKNSGNTIQKPSNNASAGNTDLVKKLQNSPTRGKAPIEGTVRKISKENRALIFNPNPMISEKFNSSMTPAKSLNAFSKSDSNNPGSFHPIQSEQS